MKAILKPEEERKVTPGPKAVEDLEGLASPILGDTIPFYDLEVSDAAGKVMESYRQVDLMVSPPMKQSMYGIGAPRIDLCDAIQFEEEQGFTVPSAPLLFSLLSRLYRKKDSPSHGDILYTYVQGDASWLLTNDKLGIRFLTNSVVDWTGKQVVHYPQKLGGSWTTLPMDGMINEGRTYSRPISGDIADLWKVERGWWRGESEKTLLTNVIGAKNVHYLLRLAVMHDLGLWVQMNDRARSMKAVSLVASKDSLTLHIGNPVDYVGIHRGVKLYA